jgi:hypothetical protein
MFDRASPWRLLRRLATGHAAARGVDPADMGTAFGLDFSLADSEPTCDAAAAERPDSDDPACGLAPLYRAGL